MELAERRLVVIRALSPDQKDTGHFAPKIRGISLSVQLCNTPNHYSASLNVYLKRPRALEVASAQTHTHPHSALHTHTCLYIDGEKEGKVQHVVVLARLLQQKVHIAPKHALHGRSRSLNLNSNFKSLHSVVRNSPLLLFFLLVYTHTHFRRAARTRYPAA